MEGLRRRSILELAVIKSHKQEVKYEREPRRYQCVQTGYEESVTPAAIMTGVLKPQATIRAHPEKASMIRERLGRAFDKNTVEKI